MGSRALERAGHRVIAYDARGHGRSTPAPSRATTATSTSPRDLRSPCSTRAASSARCSPGASMGAHTAVRLALEHPERVAALAPDHARLRPGARTRDAAGARALGRARARGCARGASRASSPPTTSHAVPEALARDGRDGPAPAPVRARAPRRGRRRARSRAALAPVRRHRRSSARSRRRRSSSAAATRPTRAIRSRSASATRARSPGRSCSSRTPGPPPRSPIAWQGGQLSRALAALAARVA